VVRGGNGVQALSLEDGRVVWSLPRSASLIESDAAGVLVTSQPYRYALVSSSGDPLWEVERRGPGAVGLASKSVLIHVWTNEERTGFAIHALDRSTGAQRGVIDFNLASFARIAGDVVYSIGPGEIAKHSTNGKELWRWMRPPEWKSPRMSDSGYGYSMCVDVDADRLYAAFDRKVVCLEGV
jgi:hypothetical protein